MTKCVECGKETFPFKSRVGKVDETPVSVCRSCRGKRAARVNQEKRERHGAGYFTVRRGEHEARGARR